MTDSLLCCSGQSSKFHCLSSLLMILVCLIHAVVHCVGVVFVVVVVLACLLVCYVCLFVCVSLVCLVVVLVPCWFFVAGCVVLSGLCDQGCLLRLSFNSCKNMPVECDLHSVSNSLHRAGNPPPAYDYKAVIPNRCDFFGQCDCCDCDIAMRLRFLQETLAFSNLQLAIASDL